MEASSAARFFDASLLAARVAAALSWRAFFLASASAAASAASLASSFSRVFFLRALPSFLRSVLDDDDEDPSPASLLATSCSWDCSGRCKRCLIYFFSGWSLNTRMHNNLPNVPCVPLSAKQAVSARQRLGALRGHGVEVEHPDLSSDWVLPQNKKATQKCEQNIFSRQPQSSQAASGQQLSPSLPKAWLQHCSQPPGAMHVEVLLSSSSQMASPSMGQRWRLGCWIPNLLLF